MDKQNEIWLFHILHILHILHNLHKSQTNQTTDMNMGKFQHYNQ